MSRDRSFHVSDFIQDAALSIWSDIADAIAERRAVAFAGAGISATVGLKTWADLLKTQLAAAKLSKYNPADLRKVVDVFDRGDLTLTASLLKRMRGLQFTEDLANEFSRHREPGFAHRAVARLPFAHVITTNYDPLLELAYQPAVIDPITYSQPESILDRIRKDEFSLIKLHGHTSNLYEAILTEDDFRSIQRSRPLTQCLRILFLTKHMVFIGHGLRDPDLLSLLSDLKQQFPNAGPHYAILDDRFGEEANSSRAFLYYLENSLNVRAVVYRYRPAQRTDTFIKVLTLLHGEVCARRAGIRPSIVGPTEGVERQLEGLLNHACAITGSFRGDLAFFNDKKYSGWALTLDRLNKLSKVLKNYRIIDDMAEPGLYVDYSFGPTSRTFTKEATVGEGARRHVSPDQAYPWSMIWTAFHGSRGPVLLCDANDREEKHEKRIEAYRESDTRVISELAVPIHVGDHRMGILNLESNIPAAFTPLHTQVAEKLTQEIGYTWDRIVRSDIYRDVTLDPNEMRIPRTPSSTHRKLRLLDAIEEFVPTRLRLASFVADHGRGELLWRPSQDRRKSDPDMTATVYSFAAPSFASMVFRKGRPLHVPNRNSMSRWVQISADNAEKYKVGREIVGVPLFSRGLRIGVLTAWLDEEQSKFPLGPAESELIIRTAQLFARTDYLRQITQFQDQHELTYQSCAAFLRLLKLGTASAELNAIADCIRAMIGVCGVRLFTCPASLPLDSSGRSSASRATFTCRASVRGRRNRPTDRNSSVSSGSTTVTKHLNRHNSSRNPFVEYLIQRATWSSSAVLLYPKLLDSRSTPRADFPSQSSSDQKPAAREDPVAKVFGRDPRAGWYAAPITRCSKFGPAPTEAEWSIEERHMFGFISADNTLNPETGNSDVNELPASRTWHELARLKLSWCAAMLGYYWSDQT